MSIWGDNAAKAMRDNPAYFVWWYTAKSVALVAALVVIAFLIAIRRRPELAP